MTEIFSKKILKQCHVYLKNYQSANTIYKLNLIKFAEKMKTIENIKWNVAII